ncbi:MAG: nitroreductase family protein [Gemmatimonadales bacterium]
MNAARFVPLATYREYPPGEMLARAIEFREEMSRRRTVRSFADRLVDRRVIDECIRTAGTAPSGAHMQPWTFVVVSNPKIKKKIRDAAEAEERAFYGGRAPQEWLDALAPLGTDENKPYLERAPYLIAVFAQRYLDSAGGKRVKHYYAQESVGIATGMLIAALHHSGLVALTHTPSPMGFLNQVLERPDSERPFLVVVVGYPEADAKVPDIERKPLEDIATFM